MGKGYHKKGLSYNRQALHLRDQVIGL